MRIRALVALVLLVAPAMSGAQAVRIPRSGRGPSRPAPLPPPPPSVARELSYKRLPYSVESYPLISRFEASGFAAAGAASSWTSGGMGTRVDYRLTRFLSATLDMTSSFIGGPAITHTAELGTRIRPPRSERRVYPFIDLRAGYLSAYDSYFRPYDVVDPWGMPAPAGPGTRYSHGIGGVGGGGIEYALTRMVSLTTSASVMRTSMTSYGFRGTQPGTSRYLLTSYRYTLGVRFNPVRSALPVPPSPPGGW